MKKILSWVIGAVFVIGIVYAAETIVNDESDTFEVAWDRTQVMFNELYTGLDLKQNILSEGAFVDGDKTNLDNQSNINSGDDDDIITLSGVASGSTNLGAFTGTTIPDNQNNKQAIQALETELEDVATIGKYESGTGADKNGSWINPQGIYDFSATSHAITLMDDTQAAFTITELGLSCDIDPTTEITVTFYQKTAGIGYGTPTLIKAVTTVAGVATDTSGFTDATIPAGSKIFVVLSDPDDALIEVAWHFLGVYD